VAPALKIPPTNLGLLSVFTETRWRRTRLRGSSMAAPK
jgi:hypothetical protein